MRIQIEKFLAVTAMLASTAVIAGGCSSEDTKTNNPGSGGSGAKGGTGGKDGSTGGTGGTATGGAAGTSTGGAAGGGGVAGGGGTAGSGGAACLGDGDPDAGTEGIDCTGLTYYGTMCGADPDAGVEGTANLGTQFCEYMSANGRAEVSADVYSCLAVITDPCSTAGEAAVQSCYSDAAQKACQHSPLSDNDGGTYDPCVDLNSTCAEVSVAECNLALNPLTSTYVMTVLQCYDAATGNCKTDFEDCVNLP